MRQLVSILFLAALVCNAGEKPGDVKPIPPPGVPVPDADKTELETGIKELGGEIDALRTSLKGKPALLELLPDVQIYHNAVRYALTYNEFFKPAEIATGKALLKQGLERAKLLKEGNTPWTTATGLVARGYVSKIDGSVQPYGLVVPTNYAPGSGPHRLDTWFHGRGENLSELNFINERQKSPGEFTPAGAFVLHLYGRYCCANKLAGEVDLFEALDSVKKHYPIDNNRIIVRGFSMGGAACWHYAVHFAGLWCAAAPGAGFSETAGFLNIAKDPVQPTWFEQKLWHMYDSTDYAVNLFNCPTVAYSGEIDHQKQAADMMAKALEAEGLELTHIIGPNTPHRYEPKAKEEVNRRIDSIAAKGRNPVPAKIRFTTWTLRYNEMFWVTVDSLEKHWERARVDAEISDKEGVKVTTQNVDALTLNMLPGQCPFDPTHKPKVKLDGKDFDAPAPQTDRSWTVHFRKSGKKWALVDSTDDGSLHKRHGLQGPIDDAFMDSFIMVRPTGKAQNEKVGAWVAAEQAHAIDHWRKTFRGEARVMDDSAITDAEIASSNLVLWGDPSSNKVLAKIADKLPIKWDDRNIIIGAQGFSADHHVPALIYPNPLNPKKYVVLNSGFTFREFDYLNNARQLPKLPDYAVINVDVPPSPRWPGEIVHAGFFGENWELMKPEK